MSVLEGGRGGGRRGPARGSDLRYNMELTLEEAVRGVSKEIKIPTQVHCEVCNGSGAHTGSSAQTCPTCHGYIKHLHQHRAPALDPVADDIASYGLDLKIAEDGFRRAGLNLLFVI